MSAPFRIEKPVLFRSGNAQAGEEFREYLSRLLKMIPAEVLGVYTIGAGFIPKTEHVAEAVWASICLVLVVVVRLWGTADPSNDQGPQKIPVAVAAIAFVIWIYNLGGPFATYGLHVPYIGSLAVLLWSFAIPLFYKGE